MAKNIKLNIKNTQIAKAINLDNVKDKLEKKKALGKAPEEPAEPKKETKVIKKGKEVEEKPKEEAPRIRARSQSAFAARTGEEKAEFTSEPVIEEVALTPAPEPQTFEAIPESPPFVEEIKEETVIEEIIEVEKPPAPLA